MERMRTLGGASSKAAAMRMAAVVAALVVVAVAVWAAFFRDGTHSGRCPDVAAPEREPALAESSTPVPLELPANSDTVLDLGRRRSPRSVSLFLQLPERDATGVTGDDEVGVAPTIDPGVARAALPRPGTSIDVVAIDFERASGDEELIPGKNVIVAAIVRGNGQGIRVDVCIDPEGTPAGEYQGSIVFDDPRVSAGAIPFTVRLQYEKWWVVAIGAIGVCGAAYAFVYAAQEDPPDPLTFGKSAWVGVGAGFVAAGAAFFGAYWNSPSWGGEPDDWLKTAAVVFTAFTTGFLARDAGRRRRTTEA